MVLFRMGGLRRETAAGLLAGIGDLLGIPDAGQAISHFDQLSSSDLADALGWLTADPAYQAAVGVLGSTNG
jgi:hypothetical protein